MFKAEVSQRKKVILFALLIILNIVLRIPSIPHEKGSDSFFIHSLSNSVTSFGCANWWLNWLSVFGLYPYSYASAIPFSLSGVSQLTGLTGLEMEKTILIFSIIMGLFSIFTAYILAGTLYNDFLYKYLTALFFSISQGIMIFSTWEISTRGPFIIFLPLFLFVLIKKMKLRKTALLVIVLIPFLAAIHHFFYFSILLLSIFVILKLISKVNLTWNINNSHNYLYFIGFIFALTYPFFTRTLIEAGSRYEWVLTTVIINIRYIGPVLIFFFGGLFYLMFKRNKIFEETYILVALLMLIPTMYSHAYGIYILLTFTILFSALGFRNLLSSYEKRSDKIIITTIILILISFSTFSGFYNHARTGDSQNYWYMPDITYSAATWTNNYIPESSHGFAFRGDTWRLSPMSDGHPITPTLGAEILAYKLMNESDIEMEKVSLNSLDYYLEGPYVIKPMTDVAGSVNWLMGLQDIDDGRAIEIIDKFNATYILEDVYAREPIINSIEEKKNNIFSNGRIRVWIL
ncbi:hypothetical protein [Methanosarcina sp. WWM596]|uniref:hypothetical protein n=1 Tax=Methanosarcina sp. WWM596 TaxID=1434103 RepID=UPI0006158428|nr:hypothetical protein [Methanosarcina sp. WWM596]AKB17613.1 hypothetical protein MSWHS_0750 [Methanosarcina sp. WWM596]